MRHGIWVVLGIAFTITGCDVVERLTAPKGTDANAPKAIAPPADVPAHKIAAQVNHDVITTDEVKRRLDALEEAQRPKTAEERTQFLDQLVREELAVQDATARGLERNSDVKNRLSDFRRFVLLEALTKQLSESVTVENKEVEDYYKQYQAGFKDPERIKVRQIVTNTLEEAEAIRSRLVQGDDFASLARDRSIGPGKERGGDIGWYMRAVDKQLVTLTGQSNDAQAFFPQLESVAFTLEIGQASQPVKGPDSHYYLVRLDERQPAKQKTVTEVWSQIHDGLLAQKRQKAVEDLLAKLRQQGTVVVHPERIESL